MKQVSITLALALATLLLSSPVALAEDPRDILVVANQGTPGDSITLATLRNLFLKIRVQWEDGTKVTAINDKADTVLRAAFQARVLEMTGAQEESYWQEQRIKSNLTPPPEMPNRLKAVFKVKGAVSYVYRGEFKAGAAKVLLVLPR